MRTLTRLLCDATPPREHVSQPVSLLAPAVAACDLRVALPYLLPWLTAC